MHESTEFLKQINIFSPESFWQHGIRLKQFKLFPPAENIWSEMKNKCII